MTIFAKASAAIALGMAFAANAVATAKPANLQPQ
jgi:hypothetical protein